MVPLTRCCDCWSSRKGAPAPPGAEWRYSGRARPVAQWPRTSPTSSVARSSAPALAQGDELLGLEDVDRRGGVRRPCVSLVELGDDIYPQAYGLALLRIRSEGSDQIRRALGLVGELAKARFERPDLLSSVLSSVERVSHSL